MNFYQVFVGSPRYHGTDPLTYASDQKLAAGQVVVVPLQRLKVLAIIGHPTPKPSFTTKPIDRVLDAPPLPPQTLELLDWLRSYYPAPLGLITLGFLPASLAQKSRSLASKPPRAGSPQPLQSPTTEQSQAVAAISGSQERSYLLHGDTGTGKTRVYLELAQQMLLKKRSVLALTPEIGLTPQLAASFEAAFPGQVVVVHSTLTPAKRRNAWLEIASTKRPIIIVGPRSALFSPLHNIGLIILDEAHDQAYKQEQLPHYQASRVAAQLASLHNAKLVLGTATPLVSDYYAFDAKQRPILRMQTAAMGVSEVNVEVVSLREQSDFSRSAWLSNELIKRIQGALQTNTQALVFLNRRGSARLVICRACGWQAMCPRCDLPLTYHADTHSLRCHTCGYVERAPVACPLCRSTDIVFKSIGTKALLAELQKLFPKARLQRFDSDSPKDERLEHHYDKVLAGEVDILVGTQMLSKGLDLPRLSVVGVVVADTNLYFPDYTAEERTYQMLSQVLGRVGRGHGRGEVIIQTYHPDSPTIHAAITKDYRSFYDRQLLERHTYRFPPFCFVLKLSHARASKTAAQKAAEKVASSIIAARLGVELTGPSPAFIEKTHNKYRWQIIVKANQRSKLLEVIKLLPPNWSYDLDPTNLL